MNSNKHLPIFCLVLGGIAIIAILAIYIPHVIDHFRTVEKLENAISINPPDLATINKRLLDSENNRFNSSLLSMITLVIAPLSLFISGCILFIKEKTRRF